MAHSDAHPPSGTVAMLFTDIEGSTRLAQRLPDAYDALLDRHRSILRSAFASHGGYEVGTEGDSFFATFSKPLQALGAAVTAQRGLAAEPWPDEGRIRVRMGIHVGEVEVRDGDYTGVEVHRAARIAAAGHGGQVLLSTAAAALLGDRLPNGLILRDLGEYELKDLDQPMHIHQVVGEGLIATSAARGHGVHRTNLPERRSSFIGREAELAALSEALVANRLVTLTGPGGTGKTSLAVETGRRQAGDYLDGPWLMELAPLRDVDFVVTTITQAIGLADDPARPAMETLVDHLADRRALLILDNLEQLLPAVASPIDELLRRASGITILATSREPTHVAGEQEFPVPPLVMPDTSSVADGDSEAVHLFVERAQAVVPDFSLTDANRSAVQGLVRRLDGLPLAIELAAARVKVLSPAEILERLSRGSGELASAAAAVPERQRTLREAIGWSYRLLAPAEQTFFARISVFAGGCDLEAAEAVCNPNGELGVDTLDALASLVDKSLLKRAESPLGTRFELLATISDLAREQLAELDPASATASRLARYMLELAERAAPLLTRPGDWRARLTLEVDNLRAALRWAIEHGDPEVGAGLCAALWRFWHIRALLPEGRDWTESVLAMDPPPPLSPAVVRAQYALGSITYWQRDKVPAQTHYRAGIAGAQELGDPRLEAEGWVNLIYLYSVFTELSTQEETDEIAARIERLSQEVADPVLSAHIGFARGGRLVADGNLEEARARAEKTLGTFEESGDLFLAASANNVVGGIALAQGDVAEALRRDQRAADLFYSLGDDIALTLSMRALATIAAKLGNPEAAARLDGFSARLVTDTGVRFRPPFEPEDAMALARAALGDERADAEREAGRNLGREEAMDLVRSLRAET